MKVPKNAFVFCRISLTILAWLGFILKSKELILLAFLILLASAILKIQRAPLIVLYSKTVHRFFSSAEIDLDEQGMRFAHILGSVFSGLCVLLLYLQIGFAWRIVFLFALLKTISAFGFCPGEKMYSCLKGGCCGLTRKNDKSSSSC